MSVENAISLIPATLVIGGIFGIIFVLDKRDERRAQNTVTASLVVIPIATPPTRRARQSPISPQQRQEPTLSRQSFFRLAIWFPAFLVSLAANIAQLWGPFWPTNPDIQFHDTVDASSFVLPFKITNRSILFSMNNMNLTCGVDLIYFIDADRKTGVLRDALFNPGPLSIGVNSPANYPCTASDYVRIQADGSVIIGIVPGQFMTTKPGAFRAPLTVLKMCMWMRGSYTTPGLWTTNFRSNMFQWPAAPGQQQWIEGPITPDLPNDAWIPKDSKIGAVWAFRGMMTSDKQTFAPGALQCDRI